MIVFVLRHAEKKTPAADELSAAGKARAERLARMLEYSGVTATFRSDKHRTLQTLQPLLSALEDGVPVSVVPVDPTHIERHIDGVAQGLLALPDESVAVVVTHNVTVGPIISAIGGGPTDPITEDEFDNIYVVFRDTEATQCVRLKY